MTMNWDIIRKEFFEYSTYLSLSLETKHSIVNWFKQKTTKKPRSSTQNSALHLYYNQISEQLNNAGYDREVQIGKELVKVPYTPEYIKEFWRTVQMYLFDIKSTTKINTEQINKIIDVFCLHFAEKNIYVEFPNWQSYMNKQDAKRYNQ